MLSLSTKQNLTNILCYVNMILMKTIYKMFSNSNRNQLDAGSAYLARVFLM